MPMLERRNGGWICHQPGDPVRHPQSAAHLQFFSPKVGDSDSSTLYPQYCKDDTRLGIQLKKLQHVETTPAGVDNVSLVTDCYQHWGFNYMNRKSKVETNHPGQLAVTREENNDSCCRAAHAGKCYHFAVIDLQPARVLAMVKDPRAYSDDESEIEADSGIPIYSVNKKGLRGASAASFLHSLDPRAANYALGNGKRKLVKARKRIPSKAPIDWFDPAWFNELPAQARFDYAQNGVALLLLQFHNNTDYKTMDKNTFMEAYGNDVLKQYNVPTEEEMTEAGNNGYSNVLGDGSDDEMEE
ncbi:hypothetical protein C8R46DRAFT_1035854 [Mycena filopes]|nr:hypothetical protein C8R46DRAFT_1035854 [Mycena filopes]